MPNHITLRLANGWYLHRPFDEVVEDPEPGELLRQVETLLPVDEAAPLLGKEFALYAPRVKVVAFRTGPGADLELET